jgi:hypothetical protein
MTPDEKLIRANRAQQLLSEPLLIEAWDGLEEGAIERIAACDASDAKTLQALTLALQAVRAVRRRFEVWVIEGKDEAQRQERQAEKPGLMSRFRRAA